MINVKLFSFNFGDDDEGEDEEELELETDELFSWNILFLFVVCCCWFTDFGERILLNFVDAFVVVADAASAAAVVEMNCRFFNIPIGRMFGA